MNRRSSVAIFERAAIMLAEADTIQKTKDFKSMALTALEWAKQKGLGKEAEQHCFAYAMRAEIKMGGMLAQTKRATGAKGIGKAIVRSHDVTALPTLADLGLSKRESAEAQAMHCFAYAMRAEIKLGEMLEATERALTGAATLFQRAAQAS